MRKKGEKRSSLGSPSPAVCPENSKVYEVSRAGFLPSTAFAINICLLKRSDTGLRRAGSFITEDRGNVDSQGGSVEAAGSRQEKGKQTVGQFLHSFGKCAALEVTPR